MKNKKIIVGIIIAVVIITIVLGLSIFIQENKISNFGQDVIDRCKIEKKWGCDPDCVDGFGEDCYFDSNQYNINQVDMEFSLPEEIKNKCFGVHTYAACGNCVNDFELKQEDKFAKVSCEKFYQTIKDKNSSCVGCVDTVLAGCC